MHAYVHIVDDVASFRTTLERRLKLAGYRVATYASARQLLDQLPGDEDAGCIVLDVRIPGMSGTELQMRLNELEAALPIVFHTGYADTATTVQAIKAGAEDFLTKPIADPSPKFLSFFSSPSPHPISGKIARLSRWMTTS